MRGHVEAPRAARRRRRHARPRRVAARERPAHGAPPHHAAAAPAARGGRAARDAAEGARARGDADGRARRLHERRQVDAAERAHRRRGLGREPALRDARPDDARASSTTASATSSPTRSASSAGCRRSSSRASRRRSRRRSSPTSSSTSSTRSLPEERARASRSRRSRRVLAEIGADEMPVELVLNKIDRLDPLRAGGGSPTASPTRSRSPPRRARGSTSCRARIAERFADRFDEVRLLVPYDEGARARPTLYALGAPIDERTRHRRRASSSVRGSRTARCDASRRTSSRATTLESRRRT